MADDAHPEPRDYQGSWRVGVNVRYLIRKFLRRRKQLKHVRYSRNKAFRCLKRTILARLKKSALNTCGRMFFNDEA